MYTAVRTTAINSYEGASEKTRPVQVMCIIPSQVLDYTLYLLNRASTFSIPGHSA